MKRWDFEFKLDTEAREFHVQVGWWWVCVIALGVALVVIL